MKTILLLIPLLCLLGCASPKQDIPDGYDKDLTPHHNGEHWHGGAEELPQ